MRIALFSPGDFPIPATRGGSVEIYLDQLSRRLAMRKHKVHLYTRFSPTRFRSASVLYHSLPGIPGRGFLGSYIANAAKSDPSIIQIDNRPLWVPAVKNRFPNKPVVVNLHSLTFLSGTHNPLAARAALKRADAVVVNSHYIKRAVTKLAPYAQRKLHVIYPGVDTHAFYSRFSEKGLAARRQLRSQYGIGDKPVVLFTGRFIPRKGVHVLLRAMQQLWRKGVRAELWIVGGGGLGEAYRKQIRMMARGWPVRFIGFVPPHTLPRYYAAADLFVCPSQQSEAFGLVNLEAASTALPVLASGAWGIRESVLHGKNGFLVSNWSSPAAWAAQIAKLLNNREYAKQLGGQGRQIVASCFTWNHTAANFEKLYNKLLQQKGSAFS